jgi:hypothetical protein
MVRLLANALCDLPQARDKPLNVLRADSDNLILIVV